VGLCCLGYEYSNDVYSQWNDVRNNFATLILSVRKISPKNVRFEVFTAVTMKNAAFWDVSLCRPCVNRRSCLQPLARGFFYPEDGGYTFQTAATCSHWFLARGFFCPEDAGDAFLRTSHKTSFSIAEEIYSNIYIYFFFFIVKKHCPALRDARVGSS
jgi:hypothetical protein